MCIRVRTPINPADSVLVGHSTEKAPQCSRTHGQGWPNNVLPRRLWPWLRKLRTCGCVVSVVGKQSCCSAGVKRRCPWIPQVALRWVRTAGEFLHKRVGVSVVETPPPFAAREGGWGQGPSSLQKLEKARKGPLPSGLHGGRQPATTWTGRHLCCCKPLGL